MDARLDALLAKVEACSGPDREIDYELARFDGWTFEKGPRDREPYWRKPGVTDWWDRVREGPPRYTASVDAALALVERMLPLGLFAASFGMMYLGKTGAWCQLTGPSSDIASDLVDYGFAQKAGGERSQMPLAIILALLRALSARALDHRGDDRG